MNSELNQAEIEKIKNGDRRPIQNAQSVVNELNAMSSRASLSRGSIAETAGSTQIHWSLANDSVGPCLRAKIEFKHPEECLRFANAVHELQEASDHHSNFVMEDFKTVTLTLSTHHPVPAITTVDALFAKYVQSRIS